MAAPPLLIQGPEPAPFTFVLAHGAGLPMDAPFMTHFAEGLVDRGLRVVRFEFPYMAERRASGKRRPPDRMPVLLQTYCAVIDHLVDSGTPRERLAIGGKSMGGRVASLLADDCGIAGLVCLGYPFHPQGKPERLRVAHLAALKTPTLICQGTRDPLGTQDEVAGYTLSSSIALQWSEDGDHHLAPRHASGRTAEQNWQDAMDAIASFLLAEGRQAAS